MDKVFLYAFYFIGGLFSLGLIVLIIDHTVLRNRLTYADKERGCGMMGCAAVLFCLLLVAGMIADRDCGGGRRLPGGPSQPPPVPRPPLR